MAADVATVAVTNLTPTFWSVCVLTVIVIGALIKVWPTLDRNKRDADASLRGDLLERVEKLEGQLAEKERNHAAEIAIMRHRLNNVTQCLDALLLLIEAAPEKASEAAEKIRKMRAEQIVAEAAEKGSIHAARIAAGKEGNEG